MFIVYRAWKEQVVINDELLKILVCPKCKGKILKEQDFLVCYECKKKFPIKDEIPVMLIDEALPLEDELDELKDS